MAGQGIRELLALKNDGEETTLAGINQRGLPQKSTVNAAQQQLCCHGNVKHCPALRRYGFFPAQILQDFSPPFCERLAYGRSPVNRAVSQFLHRPFEQAKTVFLVTALGCSA